MPYATQDDMVARYGSAELTALTDTVGAGVPNPDTVSVALADASEVIDGFLGTRYQLPIAPVPQLVVRWACDIARYFLWKSQPSDAVATLYKAALAALAAARDGDLELQVAATPTITIPDSIVSVTPGRQMSDMGGW